MRWLHLSRSGGQNRPVNCLKTCYKVPVLTKHISNITPKTDNGSPTRGYAVLWLLMPLILFRFMAMMPTPRVVCGYVDREYDDVAVVANSG